MLKLDESKKKRMDELSAVAEKTDEQKAEIARLESEGKKGRYEELFLKPEAELTDDEVNEFLKLSEEIKTPKEETKKDEKPADADPEGEPDKKYAGIYNSIEDLAKGILSSESERTRIEKEHPDLIPQLEDFYKDSQRKVTKLVQEKKDKGISVGPKPLKDRRLFEMTAEEYEKWEKESKMDAQAWLSQATILNAAQKASCQKVFEKHPEFFAMSQGVIPGNEAWIAFDKAATEHPEWLMMPNGPELTLEESEKGKAKPAVVPKPVKKEVKPDFSQGKAGGGAHTQGKLTTEEFEKLSAEDQRKYLESSIKF